MQPNAKSTQTLKIRNTVLGVVLVLLLIIFIANFATLIIACAVVAFMAILAILLATIVIELVLSAVGVALSALIDAKDYAINCIKPMFSSDGKEDRGKGNE